MSLRWRFTLLVSGLLAVVLVALGVWIRANERTLARQEVSRRLDEWVRRTVPEEVSLFAPGEEVEPTTLADGPEGVPLVVEWYARDRRIAVVTNATQPLDLGPPPPPQEGPRPGPAPLRERTLHGTRWFLREIQTSEAYELEDGRAVRAPPGRRPGRRPRPGDRPGRGGRRPPRPPRPGEAEEGRVRPVVLRARIAAEAEALLGFVGYDDRVRRLLLLGLGALVVGALFSWFVSGAMVRPIGRAARAAEAIQQLRQRLPEPGSKDELGRLVDVLNRMLARLEQGALRERQFLGTASHELRRPLAALTAELELAERGERSAEDLRAAIDLALGDARNMARLVDDLLAHARARAGALTMHEVEVDLVVLVADAVLRCERIAGDEARIEVGAVPEIVLRADGDALGRVIENLVLNAVTHGGDGVRVRVSATSTPAGVSIAVEDDGPGIPTTDQARIFDAFGRGDRARSRPGSGLGLAIVRDLVEAHDGTIAVESPLSVNGAGRGSRFTVRLPLGRRVSAT